MVSPFSKRPPLLLVAAMTNVPDNASIHHTVDHLFRREAGKMTAVLTRLLGLQKLGTAQDIVQDTLLQAMTSWAFSGIPANPSAWLYHVAKNKAIDYLRREKKFRDVGAAYSRQLQTEYSIAAVVQGLFLEDDIEDSQLRMMFACCHPGIPEESQIALTLKTLCGLSVNEIARGFLTNDETIQKRIYRAKDKIKSANIELDVPPPAELMYRTDAVLKCLYLMFNEGYNSSQPNELIREDLCFEAMRLCELLTRHRLTSYPRTHALMALFCFQSSRFKARLDDNGQIILLRNQDRTKWFQPLLSKGFQFLENASEPFETSVYHLEAAIASLHANASIFEETDWPAIYHFYEILHELQPGRIIALNKAIAVAFVHGPAAGLEQLLAIKGLENHYLYHAALGEIYEMLHQNEKAIAHLTKALALTPSRSEQDLLRTKQAQLKR